MKKIILITIVLISVGFKINATDNIYWHISKDILSRIDRDFYHYTSEEKNIEKIMHDSIFKETDLNNDEIKEIIVKLNWFSDGNNEGIPKGHNYLRGAQDQGNWYIYKILNAKPTYIGTIKGGSYKILPSITNGYKDIEAYHHMSAFEFILNEYKYNVTQYELISSTTRNTENKRDLKN